MLRRCGRVALVMAWTLLSLQTNAQTAADTAARRPLAGVKTSAPPAIDGDLADPAWKEAPPATRFYERQNGNPTADQTTAYLLYDDRYLYVAFRCLDREPDKIIARETIRDSKYANDNGDNEDNVEVILDPFLSFQWNDQARFSVNALGTRSARITGGRAGKAEWKGDWDAAAKRTPDGWTAEMRIPWAILSYPRSRQPLTIGINFQRWQDHTKIQSIWSNTGPQGYNENEGRWTGVAVPASAFRPTLSLLPYVMPGLNRGDPTFRSGIDARYTLTPELTAVATVNPDFGTIEGAVEGIQFSRAERFVPEKRPFFLEGRDYFNAGDFYELGPYFYSDRIRTFDLGTKVYGKLTPTDTLGFLHTIDFHNRSDVVLNYRRDLTSTSQASLFFLQKSAIDDNNTVGVFSQHSRWGKFNISSQWAFSGGQAAGGGAQQLAFSYEDKMNFNWIQLYNISPLFRDADGLIFFTDVRGINLFEDWGANWKKGFWRAFHFNSGPTVTWHTDGRPFQRGIGCDLWFETRSDYGIGFDTNYTKFDDQVDNVYGIRLRANVSNRFRQFGVRLATGRQADRPYSFVGPEVSLRTLRKLDIAYGGAVQSFEGRQQQHVLTLNYELSPSRSFGGRVVVQDANTNWYLSYRNSGEKGMETFFILGDPNALRFTSQVAIKFVFAL